MQVDEPRRNNLSARVYPAARGQRLPAPHDAQLVAADRNVRRPSRRARAIDDRSAADKEVYTGHRGKPSDGSYNPSNDPGRPPLSRSLRPVDA
jgi:hypothetical protein